MKNQKGLGLIGILLIIGALILTAGGVVWERKVSPMVTPPPTPTDSPTGKLPIVKPTGPPIGEPKVGQECTYDYECSKLGRCTLTWPLNCWEGKCVDGRCVLEKIPAAPSSETPISFSELWQRKGELLDSRLVLKAKVNLLVACPQYEGCCKPGECLATVILGENLGANYVSILLHENNEQITCRWPKENSNDCQDWEKDGEYLITGILGQEKYSFHLEVLSKQKL